MKKTLLQEVKAINKIAGTEMTKEQEIAFIKERLNELEFDSQKELDAYKKAHKVRKGTQLKVRTTKEKPKPKWQNTYVGKKIAGKGNKGLDWFAKLHYKNLRNSD